MLDDHSKGRPPRLQRDEERYVYTLKALKRRFSILPPETIDYVFRRILEDLQPCRDRTVINSEAIKRLNAEIERRTESGF